MSLRDRLDEVRAALGPPAEVAAKLRDVASLVRTTLDRRERRRRLQVLRDAGEIAVLPTEYQVWQASFEMLSGFILPSNHEFFALSHRSEGWILFLRLLDAPCTLLDPSGLAISERQLVHHLLHAVHVSAGYDVDLLRLFPDGLATLERELDQLLAGTHPRQAALEALRDRPDWPHALRAALDRYEADPVGAWRVITYDVPEACLPRMVDGIERFGTIGRLMRHATTLPATPWASVRRALGWDRPRPVLQLPGPTTPRA